MMANLGRRTSCESYFIVNECENFYPNGSQTFAKAPFISSAFFSLPVGVRGKLLTNSNDLGAL